MNQNLTTDNREHGFSWIKAKNKTNHLDEKTKDKGNVKSKTFNAEEQRKQRN